MHSPLPALSRRTCYVRRLVRGVHWTRSLRSAGVCAAQDRVPITLSEHEQPTAAFPCRFCTRHDGLRAEPATAQIGQFGAARQRAPRRRPLLGPASTWCSGPVGSGRHAGRHPFPVGGSTIGRCSPTTPVRSCRWCSWTAGRMLAGTCPPRPGQPVHRQRPPAQAVGRRTGRRPRRRSGTANSGPHPTRVAELTAHDHR